MSEHIETLTIRRPDDWHVHLRDGAMLGAVADFTARVFARAIVMPNLDPPVTTPEAAAAYRARILDAVPKDSGFTPLMTCYLMEDTDPEVVARGFADGAFAAVKLYPKYATTNAAYGVNDVRKVYPVLDRMQAIGMPLLLHGEVMDADVDIFDREALFVDRVLGRLLADFPALNVVLEHLTSAAAATFVRDHQTGREGRLGATITAHHLHITRNALFEDGFRPHMYCLPLAKREEDKRALRAAATSGESAFFLGTDSAPHAVDAKEADFGCAGVFTAHAALELYARAFAEEEALDRLEAFASLNGPAFYGLPPNEGRVRLVRDDTPISESIDVEGRAPVRPFFAGQPVGWRVETENGDHAQAGRTAHGGEARPSGS
ncbi:MAG: dihydroorotase [Rhodospirillales bacterium]|jgi:dihydroorotase|nr:dihydroorotase [Rhodospirillales bacterium]